MFRSFFASKEYFWRAYGRGVLLVALTFLNVWLNIQIGREIAIIGKILEHVSLHRFMDFTTEIWWLIFLRFGFVLSDPATHYQSRIFAIDWRKAITENFIPRWEGVIGKTKLKGISQRLQEEPYGFSKFFDSMGFQLLHAVLAVLGFGYEILEVGPTVFRVRHTIDASFGVLPILAFLSVLSGSVGAIFLGKNFKSSRLFCLGFGAAFWDFGPAFVHIHCKGDISVGWLPIIAGLVFLVGIIMAIVCGYKVPRMENHNRDKETEFRELCVLMEDEKEPYCKENLQDSFDAVYQSYVNMFWWTIPLETWKSIYWNTIAIIPWMIGGYWIFSRVITIGGLPQIAYNFEQCMGGLSLFINNWRQIVDFIATKNRLKSLANALDGKEEEIPDDTGVWGNPWHMM